MLTRRLVLTGSLGAIALVANRKLAFAEPTTAPSSVATAPFPGMGIFPTNVLYPEG